MNCHSRCKRLDSRRSDIGWRSRAEAAHKDRHPQATKNDGDWRKLKLYFQEATLARYVVMLIIAI